MKENFDRDIADANAGINTNNENTQQTNDGVLNKGKKNELQSSDLFMLDGYNNKMDKLNALGKREKLRFIKTWKKIARDVAESYNEIYAEDENWDFVLPDDQRLEFIEEIIPFAKATLDFAGVGEEVLGSITLDDAISQLTALGSLWNEELLSSFGSVEENGAYVLEESTKDELNSNYIDLDENGLDLEKYNDLHQKLRDEMKTNPIVEEFFVNKQLYPSRAWYKQYHKNTTLGQVTFYEHSLWLQNFVNVGGSKKYLKAIFVNEYQWETNESDQDNDFTTLWKWLNKNFWSIEQPDVKVSEHFFMSGEQNGAPKLSPYKDVQLIQKDGQLSLKMWNFVPPNSKDFFDGKGEIVVSEGKTFFCTYDGKKLMRYRVYDIWPDYDVFINTFNDPKNSEHFSALKQRKDFKWKLSDALNTAWQITNLVVKTVTAIKTAPAQILTWVWTWGGFDTGWGVDRWWNWWNEGQSSLNSKIDDSESVWPPTSNPIVQLLTTLSDNQRAQVEWIMMWFDPTQYEWDQQAMLDALDSFVASKLNDDVDEWVKSVLQLLSDLLFDWDYEPILQMMRL